MPSQPQAPDRSAVRIDYYFSVLSPFVYLVGDRLERIAAARGAAIDFRPVDIAAVGGATGWTPPAKRHPSRLAYRLQELRRTAGETGLPINLQPAHWPTDPLPASRAIAASVLAGADPAALVRATVRAVWAEEMDIAEPDTVRRLLADSGIAPESIQGHLEAGETRYRETTAAAPDLGVFGVPFFVVGEERFWGQDRLDALDRHLAALA